MLDEVIDAPRAPADLVPAPPQPGTDGAPALRLATVAAAAAATASLAACGGGGGEVLAAEPVPGRSVTLPASVAYPAPATDQEAARFLLQAQFSASDAEIAAVRSQGYTPWLQGQIAASYLTGWDWLNNFGYNDVQSSENYYDQSYPGDFMIWGQLMGGAAPVRARMALALSEMFVVSLSSIDASWRSHIIARYWDTLMQHGLGNYRDLLEAITLNVAMGYFLNTRGNLKENAAGRQPDENYAREVMQLFTIGLHVLNPDGTVQTSGGLPIETYTASDVSNLARVFTGYDLDQSQNQPTVVSQTGGGTRTIPSPHFARLPLRLTPLNHSTLEASFLGVTIAADTPAPQALKTALDTLFNHPNTAPFVCKQLIQRLVTSNPSPAYVGRVAAVFANNGAGVRGDLAFVLQAILLDEEARSPAGLTAPEFGKLREPMVRLVQWARTFEVRAASNIWKVRDLSDAGSRLGQSPLRAPSVFNFFRPGYVPPNTALSAGKVAPEFQIVNESSVGGYLNFMMSVISNGVGDTPSELRAGYARELALVTSPSAAAPSALVERLNLLLCAGQLSATTVAAITNAVGTMASSSDTNKRNRVCAAVLMVMACAEYLIQK
jgi:uncharacterized protein (DUF1800 family)